MGFFGKAARYNPNVEAVLEHKAIRKYTETDWLDLAVASLDQMGMDEKFQLEFLRLVRKHRGE